LGGNKIVCEGMKLMEAEQSISEWMNSLFYYRSEAEVFIRLRQGMTIGKQAIFGCAGSAKE